MWQRLVAALLDKLLAERACNAVLQVCWCLTGLGHGTPSEASALNDELTPSRCSKEVEMHTCEHDAHMGGASTQAGESDGETKEEHNKLS